MIGGVVLAAGGARRFGFPKQLSELEGRPLIDHALDAIRSVPEIERVIVVLGAEAERIGLEADLEGAEVVIAADWTEGAAASLRAGVAALPDAEALVITLADQPLITGQVIAAVLDQLDRPQLAARATYEGAPGHPVLIKRELFGEVAELRGDVGARDLLAKRGAALVECGHLCRPDDVDTPEDLNAIRRRASSAPGMEVRR